MRPVPQLFLLKLNRFQSGNCNLAQKFILNRFSPWQGSLLQVVFDCSGDTLYFYNSHNKAQGWPKCDQESKNKRKLCCKHLFKYIIVTLRGIRVLHNCNLCFIHITPMTESLARVTLTLCIGTNKKWNLLLTKLIITFFWHLPMIWQRLLQVPLQHLCLATYSITIVKLLWSWDREGSWREFFLSLDTYVRSSGDQLIKR